MKANVAIKDGVHVSDTTKAAQRIEAGNEINYFFDRTLIASRRPLPKRLNANTKIIIANPGASASMGLCVMIKL